jgi:predicted nucleic acid-binding protein
MEKNKVILDTSAYSALLRGNPAVMRAVQETDEITLSPVVLGELYAGFLLGKHGKRNREILSEFVATPRVKVREIDGETAERYAAIFAYLREKGTPIPTNDLWIAASAMQHGLKIITTDEHYLKIPHVIAICCPV